MPYKDKEYSKKYRESHREESREYQKKRYLKNRENEKIRKKEYEQRPEVKVRRKEYKKIWEEQHPNYHKLYYQEHKEKWKDKKNDKEYQKKWREKNKLKVKENKKNWYFKNKEKIKEYKSEWYVKNREDVCKKNIERYHKPEVKKRQKEYYKEYGQILEKKRQRNNREKNRRYKDKNYAVRIRLRSLFFNALNYYTKTGKITKSRNYGINYIEIIKHLKPFPADLSRYEIDHIKPLSSFNFINPDGSTNLEEIRKAFAPLNHQWLLSEDNLLKRAKQEKQLVLKIQPNKNINIENGK